MCQLARVLLFDQRALRLNIMPFVAAEHYCWASPPTAAPSSASPPTASLLWLQDIIEASETTVKDPLRRASSGPRECKACKGSGLILCRTCKGSGYKKRL